MPHSVWCHGGVYGISVTKNCSFYTFGSKMITEVFDTNIWEDSKKYVVKVVTSSWKSHSKTTNQNKPGGFRE